MAASTDYDAVILDVMLPGIDGFETPCLGSSFRPGTGRCLVGVCPPPGGAPTISSHHGVSPWTPPATGKAPRKGIPDLREPTALFGSHGPASHGAQVRFC